MAVSVDQNMATNELFASYQRVTSKPVHSSLLADTVDAVLNGKKCATYSYILLTALVAKATNPSVDILSMQIDDASDGAYAPRTLCKEVVYPFQKKYLNDVIDGANNDPFVNKPARYPRLDKSNKARGDGRRALDSLCDNLPLIRTRADARDALDYVMTKLIVMKNAKSRRRESVASSVKASSTADLRKFLSDLLDQGFGGHSLLLVASALYRLQYPESDGFKVIPHPVNQPGSSKRQLSDLDLEFNGKPFIGTELKDKPFTEDDVRRAAKTAASGGLSSLIFVSGRSGSLTEQTQGYFSRVRDEYALKGIYVGICSVDSLMDLVLASHVDVDVPAALLAIYDQVVSDSGTPETQMWVYERLSGK